MKELLFWIFENKIAQVSKKYRIIFLFKINFKRFFTYIYFNIIKFFLILNKSKE